MRFFALPCQALGFPHPRRTLQCVSAARHRVANREAYDYSTICEAARYRRSGAILIGLPP